MPVYDHYCPRCKLTREFMRDLSEYDKKEKCPVCGSMTEKVFGSHRQKEFIPYYDEKYKTEIRSASQEARLMKRHGDISGYDTPTYARMKEFRKRHKRQPIYFT